MNLGVITYNLPHLKTQTLVKGLIEKNYKISLIIVEFKKYKKNKVLYNHRPEQFSVKNSNELSKFLNINSYSINQIKDLKDFDYFIIGGSSIIKKEHIIPNKIINCHSGLIPTNRGLDSFKWAILNNEKLGNTLHFIDESIDYGKIISHNITSVYENDDFKKLSERHYNSEINMLINFENHIKNPNKLDLKIKQATKRMSIENETKMFENFENYKIKFKS